MRDPYTVLGLARTASEKEIKLAYRALAKQHHPDTGKGGASSKDKFSEISRAYEIIGDKEKRGQFDRGEIDSEGKPKFQGFEGHPQAGGSPFEGYEFRTTRGGSPFGQRGFGGAEDILSELFGAGARASRGPAGARPAGFGDERPTPPDLRLTAEVTIEDLARGKTNLRLQNGRQISFALPAGAKDGQVVRLAGQGNKIAGAKAGDALVTLHFVRHGVFVQDGCDLRMNADLPLATAVGGGKIAVETLDGKIALNVPAWTDSGKVFRLKGKGLPLTGGGHGDLLVTVAIALPEHGRDALDALYRKG